MLSYQFKEFLRRTGDLIVLVSDEYPPETGFGGIGSYTWNMSQGLAGRDCRVVVISKGIQASSIVIDDKVAIIRYGYGSFGHKVLFKLCHLVGLGRTVRSLLFSWNVFWQVWQIKQQTAVLAIEGPEWNAQLFWVALLTNWSYALRIHTPLATIATLDSLPKTLDLQFSLRMEALAVSKAHTIFYASEISLTDAKRVWPLSSQRLVRSPLPIDRNLFSSRRSRAVHPTVLFIGRLEAKKGIDLLIEAMPLIRQKVPAARCVVIGPDGFDDQGGSMWQKLEALVTASGLGKSVEFLGPKTYQQLPEYLQQAWVLANPSRFESFGMTCLEAVSCGSRVVVGESVGFAEWLRPSMGCVLSARTPESLAKALVPYLTTKPSVDEGYVEETFALTVVASLALDTYRTMTPR